MSLGRKWYVVGFSCGFWEGGGREGMSVGWNVVEAVDVVGIREGWGRLGG